jgi:hypothetical protein
MPNVVPIPLAMLTRGTGRGGGPVGDSGKILL